MANYRKLTSNISAAIIAEHAILIQEVATRENQPSGKILDDYLVGKRNFEDDLKKFFPHLSFKNSE